MKKHTWPTYLLWIVLTEAVGFLASLLTREGVAAYKAVIDKPPLMPPAVVFPIVWAILYLLMGVGAARVWLTGPSAERTRALDPLAARLQIPYLLWLTFAGYLTLVVWVLNR